MSQCPKINTSVINKNRNKKIHTGNSRRVVSQAPAAAAAAIVAISAC